MLSKSVARGLRFFKSLEHRLETSEATADFCEILNNMFDALNRTSSIGNELQNKDIEVCV